jgi:hypothetical protein
MLSEIQAFFSNTSYRNALTFSDLYDKLTLPQYHIGLKRGLIPIYIATVLHFCKQNLVIKYGDKEQKITPDLLNDINENPSEYFVIIENWNDEKATYIAALETVFKQHVIEREKIFNGFSYILYAMNRWYMSLSKYAKELQEEYNGLGKKSTILFKSHIKFINSLKMLDENPRDYLFEKLHKMFDQKKVNMDVVTLVKAAKAERDNAVPNLINQLINDIKSIFAINSYNATLASTIKDWYENLSEYTLTQLFPNNENQILTLLSTTGNDESVFTQRLAKVISGLRIEDWTSETIYIFLRDLQSFKKTIDDFNSKKQTSKASRSEYKIIFTDSKGKETIRVFAKTSYSDTAELLLGEVSRVIDEYNQSISEQEKRLVLMEILERLCCTEK